MELGATVCKPRNPDCPRCPLARHCLARASGRQNELPTPGRKTAQREERWLAFALSDDAGRWLVARRPDSGLLGGLWEFPMVPEVAGEAPAATLAATFGISVLVVDETEDPVLPELQATSSVGHVFTHLRITALPQIGRLREARLPAADDRYQDYRWVAPSALDGDGLPTSTLMDKLVAAVRGAGPQFIR
jgi:A/G-specific adenine glycosylase